MSKKEQEKNMLKQPSLTTSVESSQMGQEFVKGNWPNEKWWETFESNELSALVESALAMNPTIAGVKQRVDLAIQEAVITASSLYPTIYLNGDDNASIISKNGLYKALNPSLKEKQNLIDIGLSFFYEFDFWSKYRNLTRSAEVKKQAQYAEYKQAELIVSTSIAQSYFALKTSLLKRDLYQRLTLVRKKYLALQTLLNKKALLSRIPQTYSHEKYLAAKKAVSQIEKEIAVIKHMINIMRGTGPDDVLDIDDGCLSFNHKIEIPETLNLELVARRPDLMAAILRAKALSFEVGAAIADFFPNINLKMLLGLEATGNHNIFDMSSGQTNLVPAFSLPIFTAGAIRANVRGKKAMFQQAVFEYNELLLRSTQEIADALSILDDVFQKKEDQVQIVEQADLRFDIITLKHQKGLDNLLTVYESEEEVILTNLADIDLIFAQYAAAIKLIKALGGGYHIECK